MANICNSRIVEFHSDLSQYREVIKFSSDAKLFRVVYSEANSGFKILSK